MKARYAVWLVAALALSACKENKREEREVATAKPVKLAMDPDELLKPGAIGSIQKSLAKAGFERSWKAGDLDIETTAALRKFQEQRRMPATGVPDEMTVRALGLSISDVFVHGVDERHARDTRANDRAKR